MNQRILSSLTNCCFFGLVLGLSACGPKVTLSPLIENLTPRSIAVLPIQSSSGIPREKIDYLHQTLIAELKSNGFIVLDAALVKNTCSEPSCPERAVLSSKYLADGFVSLKLESASRNNFLAGYYNQVTGILNFTNSTDQQLASVEHTESERGGLIFNSGQIFQGVISQIQNSEDSAERNLSNKFVKTLVSKIPLTGSDQSALEGNSVQIHDVKLERLAGMFDQVCVNATPQSMGYAIFGRVKSSLREVAPGKYCGVYRLDDVASQSTQLAVEVRSPFGNSDRKRIDFTSAGPCRIDGNVELVSTGNQKQITLTCPTDGSVKQQQTCALKQQSCSKSRFLVYRRLSPQSPYQKVGEISGMEWIDSDSNQNSTYEVVAVSQTGNFSVPTTAKIKQQNSIQEG